MAYTKLLKLCLASSTRKKYDLVAKLISLLHHETTKTKTAHKLVFPEFLLNQITVYNRLDC